jgi:hypothetical protein
MDQSLRIELDSCISELYAIAQALEDAADNVDTSISGMSTWKYTSALRLCAGNYRAAAAKLNKIQ